MPHILETSRIFFMYPFKIILCENKIVSPQRFLSSKFDLVVEHNLERTGVSTQDCESTNILWCGDLLSTQLPRTHSIRWSVPMVCFQRRSCVWKEYLFFSPPACKREIFAALLASSLMLVVSLRGSSYPFVYYRTTHTWLDCFFNAHAHVLADINSHHEPK